jgi:thiol-disulfide isomerase/thioredoxin
MTRAVALAAAVVLGIGGRAAADGLAVGDPAPALQVKEFVKGDPVAAFDKGKTYVVEFWATWCGPCRVSIPHLTELQKKHKDLVVIGVSVWERDQEKVKPFVEEMGDKMAYRVAMDDVPEKAKGDEGKMAKGWMTAAEQAGIPTAFVVNGDGKVAWIGHPMEMDKPLEQIVSGKWDLAAAATEYKKEKAREARMRALAMKVRKARQDKDPKAELAALDEAIGDDPGLEERLGALKFQALTKSGDADKALEYGNRLVGEVLKDKTMPLNDFAWGLVEKPGEKPDPRLMKLALRAAERADELAGGKDGAVADTLAKAYFETGDAAKAVATQERALELVKGTPLEKDKDMKDRLEQYKKAAEKK